VVITKLAWVLPGYQQAAEHPAFQPKLNSAKTLSEWEDQHADISIGGHYKDHTPQQIICTIKN